MSYARTVEDLPVCFVVLPNGVRCGTCGRGWRVPGLVLNDKNFDFLRDHGEGHTVGSTLIADGSEEMPF